MSLINDALRRASQAKPPPPPPDSEPEPPLRPVEYRRPSRLPVFLSPVVLLVLGLAGWFFFKGWQAERVAKSTGNNLPVAARELAREESTRQTQQDTIKPPRSSQSGTEQVSGQRNPVGIGPSGAALAGIGPPPATNIAPASNAPVVVVEPPKPTFPLVRLQGVFYRPNNPSVVLNGKTVLVGAKVAGAKVMEITRDSVTLEWNGETKVLTLE